MKKGCDFVDTEDFKLSEFEGRANWGGPKSSDLLAKAGEEITAALQEFDGAKGIRIQFLNILNKELNPKGDVAYFRIFREDGEK